MQKILVITLLLGSFLQPAVCLGQGLPAQIGAELDLGKNLTGDSCKLRRTPPGGWGTSAERYSLYCEGWNQPSGQLVVMHREQRPLEWWLEEANWAVEILSGGVCEDRRKESGIEGVEALGRACRQRLGYRKLMLGVRAGEDVFLADFLPNNAPLIERALLVALGRQRIQAAPEQGRRMVALKATEEMLGAEAALPSIKAIGDLVGIQNLALQSHEARHYRQAEQAWQRVLRAQEGLFGLDSPALGRTLQQMSFTVRNQRRHDDAMALLERAEPLVAQSRDPGLISHQWANRAYDANFKRDYKASSVFAEKALAVLPDTPGYNGYLAEASFALATSRLAQGDFVGAEQASRRSYQAYYRVQGAHGVWTNRGRMMTARALIGLKKFDEAKSLLDEAIRSAELMYGRTIWWANAKLVEATLAQAMGDPARALEAYRAFAGVAAREQFSCYFAPCFNPYLDLLAAEAAKGQEAEQAALREAFSAVQLVESPVVSTAINQLAVRLAAANPALGDYAREQQDLAEQQGRLRAQLVAEGRKADKQRSPEKEEELSRKIRQLGEEMAGRELGMQDRFPRYAQLVARKPVEAARAADLLRPEEALLYLAQVGDKTYAFLLQGGRLKLHVARLGVEALRKRVAALRGGLGAEGNRIFDFDVRQAHALYRDLIGPLLDEVTGVRRLIVVPSGALLSLPPDVLVMQAPDGAGKTAWLARRFSLAVVPSVRALADLRGLAKAESRIQGFLGVGNPEFISRSRDAAPPGTGEVCAENRDYRALVAQLPPLPETADEVRAMSAALGGKGTLLLGRQASKASLRKSGIESREILAFATHGLLPEELFCENEPALALTPGEQDDGLLRASEIATLRLNASLVILSACNTAGADGQLGGESLSGLVRAFFFAGARNVLATHWPIASKPTVALTTGMARNRARGLAWSDALREAKLGMMDNPATAHPFFWAAFSLVGGG